MKICPKCSKEFPQSTKLCDVDGAPLDLADPPIGTIVQSRYRLLDKLGQGGMGVVYKAEHVALGKQVALKFLRGHLAEDPTVIKRFQREAWAASEIHHPGIVDVNDFGEDSTHGVFYAMEFVKGPSLAAMIAEQAPMPFQLVAALGAALADALDAAHRQGVVHRDLKPENIIIERVEGRPLQPKILDFGIAAITTSTDAARLTRTGSMIGTPQYVSPEQAMGQVVEASSDIYTLGLILYEMATGSPPFEAADNLSLLEMHRSAKPVPPTERNPHLPAGVDSIVMRCLAKDPKARPPSMAFLRDALRIGGDVGADTFSPSMAELTVPQVPATAVSNPEMLSTTHHSLGEVAAATEVVPPKRTWRLVAVGGFVAAAVVAIVVVGGGDEPGGTGERRIVEPTPAAAVPAPDGDPASAKSDTPSPQPKPPAVPRLLKSIPDGAEVYEDARFLGRTPLRLEFPAEGPGRHLEFRLAGHVARAREIAGDDASDVRIVLDHKTTPKAADADRPKPRSKKASRSTRSKSTKAKPATKAAAAPKEPAKSKPPKKKRGLTPLLGFD